MKTDNELWRQAFLAHVREKVGAPISAMLHAIEIVADEAAAEPALERLRPYVANVQTAGERLSAMFLRLGEQSLTDTDGHDGETLRSVLRHDLCTPINAIKGYGEMMLEDVEEEGDGEGFAVLLRQMLASSQTLLSAILGLSSFSFGDTVADEAAIGHSETSEMVEQVMRAMATPASSAGRIAPGRILVIDDNRHNLDVLDSRLRRDGHQVAICMDGRTALEMLGRQSFDLILLDVMMADMNGYEVLLALKADEGLKTIPVIMVSALDEITSIVRCIEAGAEDYLSKPINAVLLRARIGSCLERKRLRDMERNYRDDLEAKVIERTRALALTQDVTILTLASLAEIRDNDTGNHIRRTQHYVRLLCTSLKDDPRFAAQLDDHAIELIGKTSVLHDIGKVGIPDRILLKPGKLEPEEFEIMKRHVVMGRDALLQAGHVLDQSGESTETASFLHYAADICGGHHEKWNGRGYPDGKQGEEIPLSARLMAVADVYDALISARPYKQPFSHEQAMEIIVKGAGSDFDPAIVEVFVAHQQEVQAIAARYADS